MRKFNFNAIDVPNIDGTKSKFSISESFGNYLYINGEDIQTCELGRKLWLSSKDDSEVEIDDKEKEILKNYTPQIVRSYVARQAILDLLGE